MSRRRVLSQKPLRLPTHNLPSKTSPLPVQPPSVIPSRPLPLSFNTQHYGVKTTSLSICRSYHYKRYAEDANGGRTIYNTRQTSAASKRQTSNDLRHSPQHHGKQTRKQRSTAAYVCTQFVVAVVRPKTPPLPTPPHNLAPDISHNHQQRRPPPIVSYLGMETPVGVNQLLAKHDGSRCSVCKFPIKQNWKNSQTNSLQSPPSARSMTS